VITTRVFWQGHVTWNPTIDLPEETNAEVIFRLAVTNPVGTSAVGELDMGPVVIDVAFGDSLRSTVRADTVDDVLLLYPVEDTAQAYIYDDSNIKEVSLPADDIEFVAFSSSSSLALPSSESSSTKSSSVSSRSSNYPRTRVGVDDLNDLFGNVAEEDDDFVIIEW